METDMIRLQPGPLQNECILAAAAVLTAHVDRAFSLIRPPTYPCRPFSFPSFLCVCHYAICQAHPCSLIQCEWANLSQTQQGIRTAAAYQSKAVSEAAPCMPLVHIALYESIFHLLCAVVLRPNVCFLVCAVSLAACNPPVFLLMRNKYGARRLQIRRLEYQCLDVSWRFEIIFQ